MIIKEVSVTELKEYENNPRHNENAIDKVAASIKEFGFKVPIVIDRNNVIVAGHTRIKAAKLIGIETVPCIIADDLTPEQIKAFRLADNKTSEFSEWDMDLLEQELANIDLNMEQFGFDEIQDDFDIEESFEINKTNLQEKFIAPPFSVLDTRQGYWQDRKDLWKSIIKSDSGRSDGLIGNNSGLKDLAEMVGANLSGTSIFDPVLCEILINWFCPKEAKILDPFAGGSVRGIISALLGREYTGIDLRQEQIDANYENLERINTENDLSGNAIIAPNWICDDSINLYDHVTEKHDFMLTCPPYSDLEVYSDDPRDISNMEYDDFINVYSEILQKSFTRLKDNAFVAIVVGDIRDKKGYYRSFVSETISICRNAGLKFYNDCVLIEQVATAAMRANRQFSAGRKVCKTHQNVLIFIKGNEKEIELENYEYDLEDLREELYE